MKKIRPLTLLTKLASLVKLTGRKTSHDLSNDRLTCRQQELITGGLGAKKPPRLAFSEAQKSNDNSEKQQLNTKICELVVGGVVAKKPPRVARVSTDLKPDNPMDCVQG
ncbi:MULTISPECIES: hypothetical protein [unclassified Pseudoalteromonas]|uniref:hypothetical protein n=1 Tax=unclassified Pseudoalteromonas TaxID=194690 RepID=UPI002097CC54|nr:hypothetical protein [Pseudoalteromonas sp. XMcav2-N]MCO7189026.1 hypothetical protein [Pseudoalteromonas sp. XMcav2-N]